jgi:hypothetical protein
VVVGVLRVVEHDRAHPAHREARAPAVESDATGSVQEHQFQLPTELENLTGGLRHEAFEAERGVAEYLQEVRPATTVRGCRVVQRSARFEERKQGRRKPEMHADAIDVVLLIARLSLDRRTLGVGVAEKPGAAEVARQHRKSERAGRSRARLREAE